MVRVNTFAIRSFPVFVRSRSLRILPWCISTTYSWKVLSTMNSAHSSVGSSADPQNVLVASVPSSTSDLSAPIASTRVLFPLPFAPNTMLTRSRHPTLGLSV